ncbi:hypothetical protein GCM10027447_26780 [Glycomyces halotolerans]
MPEPSSDLRQTLHRIHTELDGEARAAALERHVEDVAAAGDEPLLNETLADLVSSYEFSHDPTRLLVPFARMLRNFDTAPEHFDANLTHRVHWMFKWVVGKMIDHPDVRLESIEEWLGQMRRRYAEAGHSLHPVHEAEHHLADHLGDHERAARALAAMTATEPDHMSDCEACRCHNLGSIAAEDGEPERALRLWAPVLEGGLRCAHEPHAVLAGSLLPLTELGRLDQARANHLHGYQITRGKEDLVYAIVKHARFCALTGNEARAVEIIAAHTRFFDLDLSPEGRRGLYEAVQLTCAALMELGLGETELPGPEQRTWRADELHELADRERRAVCERYDARNGNDHQSRTSAERVRLSDAHPHVPLGLKTIPSAHEPRPAAVPEPEPESPERLQTLLEEARAATEAFAEDDDAKWELVGRAAERLGVTLDPADEAEVLLARVGAASDLDEALALAERAGAAYAEAGLDGKVLSSRAMTMLWSSGERPETVFEQSQAVLDDAERLAPTDPERALRTRAMVHVALLQAHQARGTDPDPRLLATVEAIDAELAAGADDARACQVRFHLANARAAYAADSDALVDLRRAAFEHAEAGGHSFETFIGAAEYAAVLGHTGQHEAGLRVAETAIGAVQPDFPPFPVAAVHLLAAECSVNLGRWDAAERYAVQAAAGYDGVGENGCAAVARHLLGVALVSQERREEAIVVLEAALPDLAQMPEEEHWRLVDARYLLADAYDDLAEARAGLEYALEALGLMDDGTEHPNPTMYPRAAHLAGLLLEQLEDHDAAIQCYSRAEASWRRLDMLPAASGSLRAAVWARSRSDEPDREAGAEAMRALGDELRSHWSEVELPEPYREACREELGETLYQIAVFIDSDTDSLELLREALAVFADGEYLAHRAVRVTHLLMHRLAGAGDVDGAQSTADEAVTRLNAAGHADLAEEVEAHLRQLREAFGQ